MNRYYDILVDGRLYEGSADRGTARYLYRTVDETISPEYDGHTKSLVQMENRYDPSTWKKLFEDEIHCPQRQVEQEDDEEEEQSYHFHR